MRPLQPSVAKYASRAKPHIHKLNNQTYHPKEEKNSKGCSEHPRIVFKHLSLERILVVQWQFFDAHRISQKKRLYSKEEK